MNNQLSLWKNDRREKDSHPHFTGQGEIDGKEYWVSAWKRDADAKENAPLLKISVTPKEAKAAPKPKADFYDDDLTF